jgi:hypothetical protein
VRLGSISVTAQPHLLDVEIVHPSPAYLEEAHPVTISIVSRDNRALDVWLDALIYPSEDHESAFATRVRACPGKGC